MHTTDPTPTATPSSIAADLLAQVAKAASTGNGSAHQAIADYRNFLDAWERSILLHELRVRMAKEFQLSEAESMDAKEWLANRRLTTTEVPPTA